MTEAPDATEPEDLTPEGEDLTPEDEVSYEHTGVVSKTFEGRTFDRVLRFDPRSLAYRAGALESVQTARIATKIWPVNATLDQGQEGACVGFAWTHWATSGPTPYTNLTEANAYALYKQAQRMDQWPGEDYDGSSVLGGALATRLVPRLTRFYWATSTLEIARVLQTGPVVLGVDWLRDMAEPSPFTHTLRVSGPSVGGHAILCNGVEVSRNGHRRFRLHNSWGPDWGDKGECWITEYSLHHLIKVRKGEACYALKVAPRA